MILHYARPISIGTQGKPLSCILARQLCFEDPSCSAILEIIPRVCGPVPGTYTINVDICIIVIVIAIFMHEQVWH